MAADDFGQLVVIGSSAGGIEALRTVLSGLPADFPAPVIVAQHLDPDRPSRLADVLSRSTTLSVRTIAGREPLQGGTVFLIPPDCHVDVMDRAVSVSQADSSGSSSAFVGAGIASQRTSAA